MKTLSLLSLSFVLLFGQPYHFKKTVTKDDEILLTLKKRKAAIDKYLKSHKKEIILLAKVPKKNNLIMVKNGKWPEDAECSYNVLRDSSGKIIFVMQSPVSESGDWNIEYSHYFDDKGKTFAFIKQESIFNDEVKGGVVREIHLLYYDDNFKTLNQINNLLDKDDKPLLKNKGAFDFPEYKYVIYKNLNDCIIGYNIKLAEK
jgi:hypothetical protein